MLLSLSASQLSPASDLETARERWAEQGITAYRITVEYSVPLFSCQQDMEVRNEVVDYKHTDRCSLNPTRTPRYFTVSDLFQRIEDSLNAPQCGPNGCACDGPIAVAVTYHPELGYPQQIVYQLRPDRRWLYGEYWQALLNGELQRCPPTTYIGETITVRSLTPLESPSPTPLPSEEKQPTPDKPHGSSIREAIEPALTSAP
jgi:hypothetical protein